LAGDIDLYTELSVEAGVDEGSGLKDVVDLLSATDWFDSLRMDPEAKRRAIVDYLRRGEASGESPSREFDPEFYYAVNPDVAAAGASALVHYVMHGKLEGRFASRQQLADAARAIAAAGLFDPAFYVPTDKGLDGISLTPAEHYLVFGLEDAAFPEASFDTAFYFDAYWTRACITEVRCCII